jgi:hypothetical protein
MRVCKQYSEHIFNTFANVEGEINARLTYYNKEYRITCCIGYNLAVLTKLDKSTTYLVYQDDSKNIILKRALYPLIYDKSVAKRYPSLLAFLVDELSYYGFTITEDTLGYSLINKQGVGPLYIDKSGYLICLNHDNYYYDNLKPLGTLLGHYLTDTPFSYSNFLFNYFPTEEAMNNHD